MAPRPDPDSPDFTLGIAQDTLADGAKLLGRVYLTFITLASIRI
jgi:hypothetical protein